MSFIVYTLLTADWLYVCFGGPIHFQLRFTEIAYYTFNRLNNGRGWYLFSNEPTVDSRYCWPLHHHSSWYFSFLFEFSSHQQAQTADPIHRENGIWLVTLFSCSRLSSYIHPFLIFAEAEEERLDPEEWKQPYSDFQVKLLPCVNHQRVQPEAFQDRIKVHDGVLQHWI